MNYDHYSSRPHKARLISPIKFCLTQLYEKSDWKMLRQRARRACAPCRKRKVRVCRLGFQISRLLLSLVGTERAWCSYPIPMAFLI